MMVRNLVVKSLSLVLRILQQRPVYVDLQEVCYPGDFLKDLNCCITGGGKGIGFAIAKKVVSYGASVVVTGRDLKALEEACEKLGERASYIVFDSLDFDNYSSFFHKLYERMPNLNSMVLNAGISLHEGDIENVTMEGMQKQFDTNLKSPYFMAKEFIQSCKIEGNLLFVSSETADFKCALPYGLTKASINSLVPALSRKVYRRGIRVNGIAPGGTISNMTQNVNENKKTIIIQMPRSAISYQKKLLKWQHSSLVRHLNA